MTDEIVAGGIPVPLSHPGKILFPDDGITKEVLARYYADVAEVMLPWLRDRPVTMVRYPDGLAGPRRADDPWAGFTSARHGLGEAGKRLAKLDR